MYLGTCISQQSCLLPARTDEQTENSLSADRRATSSIQKSKRIGTSITQSQPDQKTRTHDPPRRCRPLPPSSSPGCALLARRIIRGGQSRRDIGAGGRHRQQPQHRRRIFCRKQCNCTIDKWLLPQLLHGSCRCGRGQPLVGISHGPAGSDHRPY